MPCNSDNPSLASGSHNGKTELIPISGPLISISSPWHPWTTLEHTYNHVHTRVMKGLCVYIQGFIDVGRPILTAGGPIHLDCVIWHKQAENRCALVYCSLLLGCRLNTWQLQLDFPIRMDCTLNCELK